jgi:hypothetical protein
MNVHRRTHNSPLPIPILSHVTPPPSQCFQDPFRSHPPVYASVFRVVSFLRGLPPKLVSHYQEVIMLTRVATDLPSITKIISGRYLKSVQVVEKLTKLFPRYDPRVCQFCTASQSPADMKTGIHQALRDSHKTQGIRFDQIIGN